MFFFYCTTVFCVSKMQPLVQYNSVHVGSLDICLLYVFTVLLVLSRLRTNLGLGRILNHQICIVIRALELQV
jgi:hypothetical protein